MRSAQLVLTDNEDQNDLIGTSRANAASLLPVHALQIKYLEGARTQPRIGGAAVGERDRAADRGGHRAHLSRAVDA